MPVFYSQYMDILLSALSISLLFAGVLSLGISRETSLHRPLPSWRYLGVSLIIIGLRDWLCLIGLLDRNFIGFHTYAATAHSLAALATIMAARREALANRARVKSLHIIAACIMALLVGMLVEPFFFTSQFITRGSLVTSTLYLIIKIMYALAVAVLVYCTWKSPFPPSRSVLAILVLLLLQAVLMAASRAPGIPGVHGVADAHSHSLFLSLYIARLVLGFAAASLMWNQYTTDLGVKGQIRWWPLILIFFCLGLAFAFVFVSVLDMEAFKRLALLTLPLFFVFFLMMISGQQRAWLSSHSISRTEALRQGALGNELTGVMITRGEIVVNVNRRCCDMVGIPASKLLGRNVSTIFHAEGDTPLGREVREAARDKGSHMFELSLRLGNNRLVHLLVYTRKLHEDPADLHYIWESVDITAQKEMENQVRSNRDYLQMIIDTVPVGVFVRNADDAYELVNRAFVELMGYYRMEDVLGKTPYEIRPLEMEVFRKYDAMCVNMDGGTLVYEQPMTIDGEVKLYEISKTVKWWGEERETFLMVGSVHDFTPRTKSRELVREERHFLQQLLDALPVAACFQDRAGIVRLCGRKFWLETGVEDAGSVLGKAYVKVVPLGPTSADDDEALLGRGGSTDEDFEHVRDGVPRRYTLRRTVVTSRDGEILGLLKMFWGDI